MEDVNECLPVTQNRSGHCSMISAQVPCLAWCLAESECDGKHKRYPKQSPTPIVQWRGTSGLA